MNYEDYEDSNYTNTDITVMSLLVGGAVACMLLCIKCKSISITIT
jgi:hypothetical protein